MFYVLKFYSQELTLKKAKFRFKKLFVNKFYNNKISPTFISIRFTKMQ